MMPITPADASRDIDRRMAQAREWDELVEQTRQIEGFEDFLRPPKLEKLLPAAAEGPVVIVNISQWRCDALLVTTGGVAVKELPRLNAEDVTGQVRRYLAALRHVEEAAQAVQRAYEACHSDGGLTVAAIATYTKAKKDLKAARNAQEKMLREVAEWLWGEIAGPVLEALRLGKPAGPDGPWPRLWWCPTGPLTLLPLHAAGYHTPEGAASGDAVLDRVVSSYTPTLRALLEARGGGTRRTGSPGPGEPSAGGQIAADPASRMLVVALPDTPGQMPLPNVTRERDAITRLFTGQHTLLEGSAATWEAVRARLPEHRWVHFSCHGDQNLTDPSRGGILLYDRMLTIAEISDGRYHADFAFLSACKTATGSVTLPDEAITLAASLHYTGYRHVIGTMWSVHDQAAAEVTEAVYADLASGGVLDLSRAAHALHQAVRRLRGNGRPLSHWTPFTHTGP